jgi:hypothetical protein
VIVSLTYMSTASTPFDSKQMAALLQQSRENNERNGLTGMLLFKNGRFMQVLEGAEKDVRDRYAVIAADPRHTDLKTLVDESIERRRFPQWTMGVPDPVGADLREAPGYDSFFAAPSRRFDIQEDSSRAQLLLEWFRRRA